jgi:hypothetical protein
VTVELAVEAAHVHLAVALVTAACEDRNAFQTTFQALSRDMLDDPAHPLHAAYDDEVLAWHLARLVVRVGRAWQDEPTADADVLAEYLRGYALGYAVEAS